MDKPTESHLGQDNPAFERDHEYPPPVTVPPPDYEDDPPTEHDQGEGRGSGGSNQIYKINFPEGLRDPKVPQTIWSNQRTDPEEPEEGGDGRDVWDNPIEFLLSCISMSVGLGNVWRFPFSAYSNGGGAFLIPYIIVLLFIGRPIYYLEMCLGQFSRYGQVKVWNMAPLFKGVGYGAMIGTICVVSYYCSIMAQTIFYFFASFAKTLPWTECRKEWGPEYCDANGTAIGGSAAQHYYLLEAFPQKFDIEDGIGKPDWKLTLCLFGAWAMIFLALWKGVKSSGKVAYFTAIFPYVVLIILLIRGVTLEHAWDGIKYFLEPQWEKLYDPKVWYEAVSQCFFSLSTGFGPIIMFSSYNPFRHNVYRDALIISFMDTFTSLLAGCTIFAVLGFLAKGGDVASVTTGGPGLAFVAYPQAIAEFPVPQLFAVLFFLMLFTLGIGSATSLAGGVITIICDQFPKLVRWQVTLAVCVVGFLSGLIYITPGGNFMVTLVNEFGANFVIYVMAMLEVGAVAWIYGLDNICRDIEFMLGRKVGWYWKICWGFIIPVGLFGILVYYMITRDYDKVDGTDMPAAAMASGWVLAGIALSVLPIFGLHAIMTRKSGTFAEKFREALRPTHRWGPQSPKVRKEWEQFKTTYSS